MVFEVLGGFFVCFHGKGLDFICLSTFLETVVFLSVLTSTSFKNQDQNMLVNNIYVVLLNHTTPHMRST